MRGRARRAGPTFIKVGQQFSTRVDVLAPEFVAELEKLQDNVPAFDSAAAVRIVEASLGTPVLAAYDECAPGPTRPPWPGAAGGARGSAARRAVNCVCYLSIKKFWPALLPASNMAEGVGVGLLAFRCAPRAPRRGVARRSRPRRGRCRWCRVMLGRRGEAAGPTGLRAAARRFDRTPIAAASLGQVHLARLDGQRVVVKVQRPGLKELFDIDLKNLRVLAQWLQARAPRPPPAARRARPRLSRAPAGRCAALRLPRPVPDSACRYAACTLHLLQAA